MNIEAALSFRQESIRAFESLDHPQLGPLASGGRYAHFFARDLIVAGTAVLLHPLNCHPQLLNTIERGVETMIRFQGQKYDPYTNEQPGKILHEYANTAITPTPRSRLEELRRGLPVREEQGCLSLLTYYANDTTAGFISLVGALARVKKAGNGRGDYIEKVWPNVLAAYIHQTTMADTDQDGLIESTGLDGKDHNERDSLNAYQLEEGGVPLGAVKYASTNAIFINALKEMELMASQTGRYQLQKEFGERAQWTTKLYQELFWNPKTNYPAPIIYGDKQKASIINDEALEGMMAEIWSFDQSKVIAHRLSRRDMDTVWGQRTRSINSTGFYRDGPQSYWNGMVWLHTVGRAALAYWKNGLIAEGNIKAGQFRNLIQSTNFIELIGVDREGRLYPYCEEGSAMACQPQLFSVGMALAISAEVLNPAITKKLHYAQVV